MTHPAPLWLDHLADGGRLLIPLTAHWREVIAFCSYKADEIAGLYVDPAWQFASGSGACAARTSRSRDRCVGGHRRVRIGASLTGRPFYEAEGYVVVRERAVGDAWRPEDCRARYGKDSRVSPSAPRRARAGGYVDPGRLHRC